MAIRKLFERWGRRQDRRAAAHRIYRALVDQARAPAFYARLGVPDAFPGRFDMIALHAFLVMRRLKDEGEEAAAVSQALFDVMFADMDQGLREMGVGDLSVPKKIRRLVEGFYGRVAAYEAGLGGEAGVLESALRRNLYGAGRPSEAQVRAMADYVRRCDRTLAAVPVPDVIAGRLSFAAIPEAGPGG